MHTIFASNVNDAYRRGMALCAHYSDTIPSRNGNVRRVPMPVCTRYSRPTQRVLFDTQRHANPFFHLFESLWMLAGRNDLETLTQFIPSFEQFSDDGVVLHGAYGYRWRNWRVPRWSESDAMLVDYSYVDQLEVAISLLKNNPNDRRIIVAMWDPSLDLAKDSKDIPCNDLIKFAVVQGKLDMQVFCRSNDIVFGAYGANAVHMSFLLEYMAAMSGIPIGNYYQISGDFHAYTETPYKWDDYWPLKISDAMYQCPYGTEEGEPRVHDPVTVYPLVAHPASFDEELKMVVHSIRNRNFDALSLRVNNPFFTDVAQPMYQAFRFMLQNTESAASTASQLLRHTRMPDGSRNDWIIAAAGWCSRTIMRRNARKQRER